jgi:hypothetical protein
LGTLSVGQTETYPCSVTNVTEAFTNVATVNGEGPQGQPVSDSDDAVVFVAATVTSSSLCGFDFDPDKPGDQFRLIFTPDPKNWNTFKLSSSNPGQFFYNLFHVGAPVSTPITITLPYPYVTQGANPLHVYDGVTLGEDENDFQCFLPGNELESFDTVVTLDDYADTNSDGAVGFGDTTEITVNVTVPPSGFVYVNLHMDYGLKGPHTDADGNGVADRYERGTNLPHDGIGDDALAHAATGTNTIDNCADYTFDHMIGGDTFTDAIQNVNTFKRSPGVGGLTVTSALSDPVAGASLQLFRNSTGALVATATSDEDGFYVLNHKHKGKAAMYTAVLFKADGTVDIEVEIELKGNDFDEVSFFIDPAGTTAVVDTGDRGKGGGGKPPKSE